MSDLAHTRIWLVGVEDHFTAERAAFDEIESAIRDGRPWVTVFGLGDDAYYFRVDQISVFSVWEAEKAAAGSRRFKAIKEWWEENCSTPEERWS